MFKDSNKTSSDNSIYFTVLPIDINLENYLNIYKCLVNIGFEEMFIILYDDNWKDEEVMHFENKTISLKVPSFEILKFNKELSNLSETDNNISNVTGFLKDLPKRGKNKYAIEKDCEEWLIKELSQFDEKQLLKIYMDRLFF